MPTTPDDFKDLIPAANTPICPKVIQNLITLPTRLYDLVAEMKNADGTWSDEFKAGLGLTVGSLAAPTNVAATDGTYTNKVTITWSAATGATSYQVWRNTVDSSATATQIGSPSLTTIDDTSVTQDAVYFYWVKAVNAGGVSAFSSSNSGYAANTPSSAIQFSDSGTWTVPAGVTTMKVELYGDGGGGGGGAATAWAEAGSIFVGGGGGGSGERRVVTGVSVTPGQIIGINIGQGGSGGGTMSSGSSGSGSTVTNNTVPANIAVANGGGGGGGGGVQSVSNPYAGTGASGGTGGTGTNGVSATAGSINTGGAGATGLDGKGSGATGGANNAAGSTGSKGFCQITPNG